MLNILICLVGVGTILTASQILWNRGILRGERERKFIHIGVGTFIAFWPWLISWRAIQLIGAAMLLIVLANRWRQKLHISGGVRTGSYGEVFFAAVIVLCALLTNVKIFFAIAILHLALADGAAALVGLQFGANWKYKIFGSTKTLVGSATFWVISFLILSIGLAMAHDYISYSSYVVLAIALPPALTLIEAALGYGLDNLAVPLAVLAALQIARF